MNRFLVLRMLPFLLLVCVTIPAGAQEEDTEDEAAAEAAPTSGLLQIDSIKPHDTAYEKRIFSGDRILIDLKTDEIVGPEKPFLYLNDIRINSKAISVLQGKLIYKLARNEVLDNFYQFGRETHEVTAVIATEDGTILSDPHSFVIEFVKPINYWVGRFVSVIILGIFLWLLLRTSIIRDASSARSKPFSLSKTQLLFWVVIVVLSYAYLYVLLGTMPALNQSVLILLGISASTAAAAKVIDVNDDQLNFQRHKDRASKGFVVDILSDRNGVSIHRFQNVVFSLVYGLVFLNEVFNKLTIPVFDEAALAVMGLSSVTYAGLKVKENNDKTGEDDGPVAGPEETAAPDTEGAVTGESVPEKESGKDVPPTNT